MGYPRVPCVDLLRRSGLLQQLDDGVETADVQQVSNACGNVADGEVSVDAAGGHERADEHAQPRAVDVLQFLHVEDEALGALAESSLIDRKSTRLNSSHIPLS